jgi:hypothetical protein
VALCLGTLALLFLVGSLLSRVVFRFMSSCRTAALHSYHSFVPTTGIQTHRTRCVPHLTSHSKNRSVVPLTAADSFDHCSDGVPHLVVS